MKKKITHFAILLLLFFSFSIPVAAADFEASSSVGSVSPGETFSIKISTPKAGHFSITGNNATVSTNSIWCEKSCSLSVTAGSSGAPSVSIIATDGTANDAGSKNVNVLIPTRKPAKKGNIFIMALGGGTMIISILLIEFGPDPEKYFWFWAIWIVPLLFVTLYLYWYILS